MENLDYYSVMESRIKYYATKYDPYNKLGPSKAFTREQTESVNMVNKLEQPALNARKFKRKFTSVLETMIAFLF